MVLRQAQYGQIEIAILKLNELQMHCASVSSKCWILFGEECRTICYRPVSLFPRKINCFLSVTWSHASVWPALSWLFKFQVTLRCWQHSCLKKGQARKVQLCTVWMLHISWRCQPELMSLVYRLWEFCLSGWSQWTGYEMFSRIDLYGAVRSLKSLLAWDHGIPSYERFE